MISSQVFKKQVALFLEKFSRLKRYWPILLILPILLIISLFGFWLDGELYKKNFFQQIDALKLATGYNIEVLEYHQGWFHSSASVYAAIPSIAPYAGIRIKQSINHGPRLYNPIDRQNTFAAAAINSIIQFANDKKLPVTNQTVATIDTLVDFSNHYKNKINIPAINLESIQLSLNQTSGYINYQVQDNQITHLTANILATHIEFKNPLFSMQINQATNRSVMDYHSMGLWTGNQTISLANISFTIKDKSYSSDTIQYVSSTKIDPNNTYSYDMQQSVQNIKLPFLTLNPINSHLVISGMNAEAIAAISKMSREKNKSSSTISNEVNQALSNVLTPDSMLSFSLSAQTTYGDILLDAKGTWPKDAPSATFDNLFQHIRVQVNCTAPISLVDYLITVYDKDQELAAKNTHTTRPSYDTVTETIETLSDENALSVSTKTRLISLIQQHPSTEEFNAYIDQLIILKSVDDSTGTSLKTQYKLVKQSEDEIANNPSLATAEQPAVMIQNQIKQYKEMGYIIEDNGNYKSTLVYENGQFTINNKAIDPALYPPTLSPAKVAAP